MRIQNLIVASVLIMCASCGSNIPELPFPKPGTIPTTLNAQHAGLVLNTTDYSKLVRTQKLIESLLPSLKPDPGRRAGMPTSRFLLYSGTQQMYSVSYYEDGKFIVINNRHEMPYAPGAKALEEIWKITNEPESK